MKKLLLLALVLILSVSAAGCAAGTVQPSAPASNAPASNAPASNAPVSNAPVSNAPVSNAPASDAAVSDDAAPADVASETAAASPGGILSAFDSTDIAGNPVDETVLSGKKLTMVNVWATFCGPCIGEMPDLGALNKEYADKGFQVVGIVIDVIGSDGAVLPEMVELAAEIAGETGADYPHILPADGLDGLLEQVYGVPTTIFVDANGHQVGEMYIGSMSGDEWEAVIVNLLDEAG